MVLVGLPLAALMWEATSEGTQSFWDAVSSPEAVAALKLTVGASLGRLAPERRARNDHRVGARARRLPRQDAGQRDHRPPVRPPDDRRRADAARALRSDLTGGHRRGVHADGDRPRADVRDAPVRRADGAAGAPGARPRARGGGAVARRVDERRRFGASSSRTSFPGSSPVSRSRSPRPSASSDRS